MKTVAAATTFCHVSVSIPTHIPSAVAMIGCIYEYMLTNVGRILFCPNGIRKYAINVANKTRNISSDHSFGVKAEYSILIIPEAAKGIAMMSAKRNIHFMNVTTLYFCINGLNIPRYNAKQMQLTTMRSTPFGLVSTEPAWAETLLIIRNTTPKKLSATPEAFFNVIGSLRAMDAIIIVNIGDVALTIEQSIGVMSLMARRKESCVPKYPRADAKIIIGKSRLSTFSLGKNKEISQKSVQAPMARKQNNSIGGIIPLAVRSLHVTMLTPNIAYARKQAT